MLWRSLLLAAVAIALNESIAPLLEVLCLGNLLVKHDLSVIRHGIIFDPDQIRRLLISILLLPLSRGNHGSPARPSRRTVRLRSELVGLGHLASALNRVALSAACLMEQDLLAEVGD